MLADHILQAQAEQIVQAVAELPDRTSPDDWPEAMLVTADELRAIVHDALMAVAEAQRSEARLEMVNEAEMLANAMHWKPLHDESSQ